MAFLILHLSHGGICKILEKPPRAGLRMSLMVISNSSTALVSTNKASAEGACQGDELP